jgi:hypothetical protein
MNFNYQPIPGFSRYAINREGFVINSKRNRRLRPYSNKSANKKGYLKLKLTNDSGEIVQEYLHRLVLLTFKPIRNAQNLEVNHIDTDIHNCRLANLEWVTTKQNAEHKLTCKFFTFETKLTFWG